MSKFVAAVCIGLMVVTVFVCVEQMALIDEYGVIEDISEDENQDWYDEESRCGWNEKDGYYIVFEDASDFTEEELNAKSLAPTYCNRLVFHDNFEGWTSWLDGTYWD